MLGFEKTLDDIGFTLPETSVTTTKIPVESDVVIANLYSSILWLIYAVSVIVFLKWYHDDSNEHRKKWIHKWINDNKSLTAGMFTTAVTVLLVEVGARIATCSIWTHYILRNNSSQDNELNRGIFLAVWLPPSPFFIFGINLLIICHSIEYCVIWRKKGDDLYVHMILPISLNAFGTGYSLFPAIILILAYPTQMIATLTFALAYLFATTIFSAILYKSCEQFCASSGKNKEMRTTLCFTALLIPTWIILAYLLLLALLFLYALLIGRGSAINTGPLFVISLLPSVMLSGIAWVAKRVTLNEPHRRKNNYWPTTLSVSQTASAPTCTIIKNLETPSQGLPTSKANDIIQEAAV